MSEQSDPRESQPAYMHLSRIANLFGDSDEMGDDLTDGGAFDQQLAEAHRRKQSFLQGTRLRFGRKGYDK